MKAMLLTEKRRLQITDMPMPAVGPEEVLVRVRACGICGSDVHGYDGSTGRRIPPIVMGHEAAGVIEEVGADVTGLASGDRVTFDSTIYCGQCLYCRAGRMNLCDNRRVLGVSCGDYRRHGCFAEYVSIPSRIVYKLPDGLGFEHAAMVEAVSIAVHAAGRAAAVKGRSAVVIGAGMIGQLIVQALRAMGCRTLIAVDVDQSRLARARGSGAEHALDANASDLIARIMSLTDGRGAELAFEAVGAAESFAMAIDAVRKGGEVILVGNTSAVVQFPLQSVVTREISLFGSCASSGEYPVCLDLMARGMIDVSSLVSEVAPLDLGPAWFERLYAREPGVMKVILKP